MVVRRRISRTVLGHGAVVLVALALASPAAATVQVVYDNALQNSWDDWSWATHSLAHTVTVHSAPNAISWEPDAVGGDWKALYFHHAAQAFADFTAVRFWVNGAGGSQLVRLVVYNAGGEIGTLDLPPMPAVWTLITATWADLGIDTGANPNFDGLILQANTPGEADQAVAYLDDVELVAVDAPPPGPTTVAVGPDLDRRPIDPRIYGVNWAGAAHLATGLYTVNRRGGSGTTRYNWLLDTSNRANDYYYLNIQEAGGSGQALDSFVTSTLTAGVAVVMTVPIDPGGEVDGADARFLDREVRSPGRQRVHLPAPASCAAAIPPASRCPARRRCATSRATIPRTPRFRSTRQRLRTTSATW